MNIWEAMSSFESNYSTTGKGHVMPLKAFFNPLAHLLQHRSSSLLQHQHLFQVIAYSLQPKMIMIALQTEIATSLKSVAALQGSDYPLHCLAHSRKEPVPFFLPPAQRMTTPGPSYDAAEYAFASQIFGPSLFSISGISKNRGFITDNHLFKIERVREVAPEPLSTG